MKIFKLGKDFNVVCNWKKTRNTFKHTANLCKNGQSIYETKINYINRTWERFEYESILLKTIQSNFVGKEQTEYLKIIKTMEG